MNSIRSLRHLGLVPAFLAALVAACGNNPPETAVVRPAELEIVAEGIAFAPARLELPAGAPIRAVFSNRDSGVPHGLVVATRTSGVPPQELGQLEITTGPDERAFDVGPLAAGPYLFSCPVHPNMQIEVDVR